MIDYQLNVPEDVYQLLSFTDNVMKWLKLPGTIISIKINEWILFDLDFLKKIFSNFFAQFKILFNPTVVIICKWDI